MRDKKGYMHYFLQDCAPTCEGVFYGWRSRQPTGTLEVIEINAYHDVVAAHDELVDIIKDMQKLMLEASKELEQARGTHGEGKPS